MPLSNLVAFGLVTVVLVVIPGPSVLFTISRALTVGRRSALMTVAGNALGVYVQVVAVAFGMGVLVERSAIAFTVVKYVGAAYIVYLGVQAVRHRQSMGEALGRYVDPIPAWRAFRDGGIVGVTNPKTAAFFVVVMPGFAAPAAGSLALQMLILGALFPLCTLLLDSGWALVAATARAWFARSPRRMAAIGGTGGLVMIGLGISLALTGRRT